MVKKKLQILSKYKVPQPLLGAEKITMFFPYADGRILEKSSVEIIDHDRGIIEISLSDFEVQGLKAAESQSFGCRIVMQNTDVLEVAFHKGLNIYEENGKKVWK